MIVDFLSEKEKFPYLGSYCQIGPKYALGCWVGHFLYHYISEKNYAKQVGYLRTLLNYLGQLEPSPVPLLKKTTTEKLNTLLGKFGFPSSYFTNYNNRPLRIYYIPYQHTAFNAAYYPFINSITSYKPKEEGSTPEYIFVHEIGHLLINNLTGNPEKVPESFVEFSKKFRPEYEGDLVEIFVDLFSIAVMMDTDFAAKNPFLTVFPVEEQKTIKEYFKNLISERKYATPAYDSF